MVAINLAPEQEKFVQSRIEAGDFASADELFDEAIRLMREREEFIPTNRDSIRAKIEEGLESLRCEELIDGEDFFEEMDRELAAGERTTA